MATLLTPIRIHRRKRLDWRTGLSLCALAILCGQAQAQWPQFGGPGRDFTSTSTGLSIDWPEGGPKRIWNRELGDGYSGISVDDGVLYTMYRKGEKEVVVALDAASGGTLWEHAYVAEPYEGMDRNFGIGPRATPLIVQDKVYTAGISAKLHCLDKRTGQVVWAHDLMSEFGATPVRWGYSSSPIAYKNTIITSVGGKTDGIVAFDRDSGGVVWSAEGSPNGYSSPILINVDGQEQLVAVTAREILGLDPETGERLWSHAHRTSYDVNAALPVWGADNLLFVSSAYTAGSRTLKLSRQGGKTNVEQLWHSRKMKVHYGSAIRIGDFVYASTGDNGPVFFAGINIKTGKMAFRDRGIGKSQLLLADGKLILLSEEGELSIATVTPDGVTIHARAELLERVAWTAPALVGKRLYLRDRKTIMALDLG